MSEEQNFFTYMLAALVLLVVGIIYKDIIELLFFVIFASRAWGYSDDARSRSVSQA